MRKFWLVAVLVFLPLFLAGDDLVKCSRNLNIGPHVEATLPEGQVFLSILTQFNVNPGWVSEILDLNEISLEEAKNPQIGLVVCLRARHLNQEPPAEVRVASEKILAELPEANPVGAKKITPSAGYSEEIDPTISLPTDTMSTPPVNLKTRSQKKELTSKAAPAVNASSESVGWLEFLQRNRSLTILSLVVAIVLAFGFYAWRRLRKDVRRDSPLVVEKIERRVGGETIIFRPKVFYECGDCERGTTSLRVVEIDRHVAIEHDRSPRRAEETFTD